SLHLASSSNLEDGNVADPSLLFGKWVKIRTAPHRPRGLDHVQICKMACKMEGAIRAKYWRPRPESNRGARICRPLRHHPATWPGEAVLIDCPPLMQYA